MNIRWLKILVFVIPIAIVSVGLAATQVAFQNTSRINTGLNIFITQPNPVNPLGCPGHLSPLYINNPTPIFWNVTAGAASQQEFFCIDNQGTAPDNKPAVTSTLSLGTCPSTGNGLTFENPSGLPTVLAANTATSTPVTIGVCAGSFTPPTLTGPSFTVTVT
jgi:hypothetical protein